MKTFIENETPYVKKSQKSSPPKTDHKHEYISIFTRMRIRRMDGSITQEKYKFYLPTRCIDCGHTNKKAYLKAVEVEVTPAEYRKMKSQ